MIRDEFRRLLKYIVLYRRLRGKATGKLVLEQLVLAYAKQLIAGMPEQLWRDNMLLLISECEVVHQKDRAKEYYRRRKLLKKAKELGLDEYIPTDKQI